MIEFLSENLGSIIVGAVLLAIVGAVVAIMVLAKKKGRSTCGGGCAGCPMAGSCHQKPKEK